MAANQETIVPQSAVGAPPASATIPSLQTVVPPAAATVALAPNQAGIAPSVTGNETVDTTQASNSLPVFAQTVVRSVGRYQLQHELGSGGMGTVYRAFDPQLKRSVALKVIRRSGREFTNWQRTQFLREAQAQAKLDGVEGIISILDHNFDGADGELFFTMRLIEGGTLRRRLNQVARNAAASVTLVSKLAQAVHRAHEVGVVHRDLKPENILVDAEGQPWITDFGIVWWIEGEAASRQGDAEAGAGTLNYMAPEQVQHASQDISRQTDVYGLGLILYELLTQRLPFLPNEDEPDTAEQLRHLIVHQVPFPPSAYAPGLPHALDAIVLKCLAKEPVDRYASAADLAKDLQRLLNGQRVEAEALSTVARGWQVCRRYAALTSLATAAIVQLVLGSLCALVTFPMVWLALDQRRVLRQPLGLLPVAWPVGVGLGLATSVVIAGLTTVPAMQNWERQLRDAQFVYRGSRTTTAPVMLVALDRDSLDELTEPMIFLSPKLAEVVRYLKQSGAAAVGLDFIIPNSAAGSQWLQPGGPGDAESLGQAVGEAGQVVLPMKQDIKPIDQWLAKSFVNPEWNDLGFVELTADSDDSILRRQELWNGSIPHIAVALFGRQAGLTDDREAAARTGQASLLVNYAGPAGTIAEVSFRDVLAAARGHPPSPNFHEQLSGKVLLIGTTDLSMGDRHLTPYSRMPTVPLSTAWITPGRKSLEEWMPGVEIQANIFATLYERSGIRELFAGWVIVPWLLTVGTVLGVACGRCRVSVLLAVLFLTQATWWCVVFWLFARWNCFVPIAPTWLACLAVPLVMCAWRAYHQAESPPVALLTK